MDVKPWIKDSTSKLQFEIKFGHVSKILWKSFGYRAAAMSGRQEPRSKHRHDPALEKHKKARQEMHPGFQPSSRRPTRAASSAAPQYVEGSGSSSSDTNTDEFREESREERKRKSTDRGSDGDISEEEQEIEEGSQFLQFSTSLVRECIMVSLRHAYPMYPLMFPELITGERV